MRGLLAALVIASTAWGCGRLSFESHARDAGEGATDAGTGADATMPPADAGPGMDAMTPPGGDAGADAGMDAGTVPGTDAGTVPGEDAGGGGGADSGSDLDASVPADGSGGAVSPFVLTTATYPETVDLTAACQAEIGPTSRIVDWTEVQTYYASGGDMAALLADAWPSYGAQALVLLAGAGFVPATSRHYFVERHDHVTPGFFLVHDNIDTNLLDLGSWYGFTMKVLCTR